MATTKNEATKPTREAEQTEQAVDFDEFQAVMELKGNNRKGGKGIIRPERITDNCGSENAQHLLHALECFTISEQQGGKVDISNPDDITERFMRYIEKCAKNDERPNMGGMSLAFGISRATLQHYLSGKIVIREDARAAFQRCVDFLEENYLYLLGANKTNPVGLIFLLKNNFPNYQDKVEIEVAANNKANDDIDVDELKQKYLDAVPSALIEQANKLYEDEPLPE